MPGRGIRRVRRLGLESLESRLPLATFYVSPMGSDGTDGSAGAPWLTLQQAANQVQAGDTVVVRPGNYAGFDLSQDGATASPIVFRGEPGATITGPNPRTPDGINLEGASHVTIEGFTVTGMPRAGIRSVENDHVVIRNNRIDLSGKWGIFTGFSDDLLIEDNLVSRSQVEHGIYVSNSGDRPVIRHNTVWSNWASGIHVNGDVSMGGDGIITGAVIESNTLYDNGYGGGSAINADGLQQSAVRNNLIYDTHASGISLYRIDGGGSSRANVVVNNTVLVAADGRWALNIQNGSTGNTVRNNVLYNEHSYRGAIDISNDSLAGFSSDHNAVIGRFAISGGTVQTLGQWQSATGQDAHSFLATLDELFANLAFSDYHLSPTSPARDSGTLNFAPTNDLDGDTRPSGAAVDIGALEFQVPPDNREPLALFRFEELAGSVAFSDTASGLTATYVNQPQLGTAGISGTALSLNGVNQYVALPPEALSAAAAGASFSFETWFRAQPGTGGVILSQTIEGATPGGATPAGYVPAIHLGTDGRVRSTVFWHGDANAQVVSAAGTAYNDGLWHHVAITRQEDTESLYLDGLVAGQQIAPQVGYAASYSYFLGTGQTSLWAGGNQGWHFFAGQLDEATFFNRSLSPEEVAAHFLAASQASASAWYPLDELSGSSAVDCAGTNDAGSYVNQPERGSAGVEGGAVVLNGINQYVALPTEPFAGLENDSFTFETWFRADAGTSGVILSQTSPDAAPGGAIPAGYVPLVHLGSDGRVRATAQWHGSAAAQIVSPPGTVYNDGAWHHVALTRSGNVETLYLDGLPVGQQWQPQVAYASSYRYFLGTGQTRLWAGGNGGWHFFAGQLDEALIYSRPLSAAEIAARVATP